MSKIKKSEPFNPAKSLKIWDFHTFSTFSSRIQSSLWYFFLFLQLVVLLATFKWPFCPKNNVERFDWTLSRWRTSWRSLWWNQTHGKSRQSDFKQHHGSGRRVSLIFYVKPFFKLREIDFSWNHTIFREMKLTHLSVWWILVFLHFKTQCCKFITFLPLRFYVKSRLGIARMTFLNRLNS